MRTPLKIAGVVVGAIILSTLGIAASDSVRGISNSLVGLAIESEQAAQCPQYTTPVSIDGRTICVDMFEASPSAECTVPDPKNAIDSERNLAITRCSAVSQPNVQPWRFISLSQAQQACAKAGKRLPTNDEWYRAVLGTPTGNECLINDRARQQPRATGESACMSGSGAYDMIGNVWEWVDASVQNGTYNERALPPSGYVASVDQDGIALESAPQSQELYGEDYLWSAQDGVRGMIRGGFYGSGSDAGLYALNASVELSFASPGLGFRCVDEARF